MRSATVLALAVLVALGGCEREKRSFSTPQPVDSATESAARLSTNQPAAALGGGVRQAASDTGPYEENAFAVNQGKRLFRWYNCNGCHANGGGGSGPALLDDVWIYGGDAKSVYQTIAEGRPNGMPAFGERMPKDQLWQLAAFVRSMAALAPKDAAPNRDDAFLTRRPESFMESQKPERPEPAARAGRPQ